MRGMGELGGDVKKLVLNNLELLVNKLGSGWEVDYASFHHTRRGSVWVGVIRYKGGENIVELKNKISNVLSSDNSISLKFPSKTSQSHSTDSFSTRIYLEYTK
jgi:hypothetical protein